MTINGQPMVTNFNVSLSYPSVDWTAANATLSTHPTYIFQNNSGFTNILTDGSYSWVMPTTTDYGMSYLASFYDAGMAYPSEQTVARLTKDSTTRWRPGGRTALWDSNAADLAGNIFQTQQHVQRGKPLPYLQLVTWNDYEEATEIESGIDNCVTLTGSVAANSLQWTLNGNENTVDHYTVYISSDGQNLMPLTDVATGISR